MEKSSIRARFLATKLLTVAVLGVLVTLAGLSSSEVEPAHGYKKYKKHHYHYCYAACQKRKYTKQCKNSCGSTASTCTFCARKDTQSALGQCKSKSSQDRASCVVQGDKALRKQCLKIASSTLRQCKKDAAAPLKLCQTDKKKCGSCCGPNYSNYGVCIGYFSDTATYGSYRVHHRGYYGKKSKTYTYCVHNTGSPSGAFLGGLWERSLERLSTLFPSLTGAVGFLHQDGCAAEG